MRIPKDTGVIFWMFVMIVFWILVAGVYFALADDKPDKKSYYQFTPNQVQQPATIWNPIITEDHKDNKKYKSYYQFTPNPVQPPGSIWNPLITEDDGKLKDK